MKDDRRDCRSGAVLVAALVSMLIVMGMIATLLQGTLRARRQLHTQRDVRQTELLLQAGVDRAASRLAHDASFSGETWDVPAAALAGGGEARVISDVSQTAGQDEWRIHVVAEFPLGSLASIRRSREFRIPMSTSSEEE